MNPVDEFFLSLREAFRPHDQTGEWAGVVIALLVVLALAAGLRARRRRRRAAAQQLARLIAERRLSAEDVALVTRLAETAHVTPLALMTQIDVFERATAIEVHHVPGQPLGDAADVLEHIRFLRHLLGFEKVPQHFPLLTTRELSAGQSVKLADMVTTVIGVTEGFFSLFAPHAPSLKIGAIAGLTLIHAHEARYALRCELLGSEPLPSNGPEARKLIFGHDESPARFQLRDFVRVPNQGTIQLRADGPKGSVTSAVTGTLHDISVGGAALETPATVEAGVTLFASFTLGQSPFEGIRSVVLDSRPLPNGGYRVRVEFQQLSMNDEDRLAAAVAYHSVKPAETEPAS